MHSLNTDQVLSQLRTNPESGLDIQEAQNRILQYGKNSIKEEKKRSKFFLFIDQFRSPIVYLLVFATSLSFYFEEWLDGGAILVVILVNSLIGFYMESQAANSMEALKKLAKVSAKVRRNGIMQEMDSEEIVPGDIIYLEAGDLVPADSRIFSCIQFQTDESALTGESTPSEKSNVVLTEITPLAERANMIFKGTYVTRGNAFAIVTATGMYTEIGKIAEMLQVADSSSTPLEKKLSEFSKKLIIITVILVVAIFIAGLLNGQQFLEMLETSIALAVAAIPEGLPIVATLALAQGMLKMAKLNIIVKKLSAVETLGGTNVICTDKTGTLTQNRIETVKVITSEGSFQIESNWKGFFGLTKDTLLQTIILCNTSELNTLSGSEYEIGDPLETGLLKFAKGLGFDILEVRRKHPKEAELPFNSETKIMVTVHKDEHSFRMFAKGAAEEILKKCQFVLTPTGKEILNEERVQNWLMEVERMASSGLKVIGVAYKDADSVDVNVTKGLVFVGLIGLMDPPRPEVFAALEECGTAGINVIMITGDHPSTAKNIALKLGIVKSTDEKVILGTEMSVFEDLTDTQKTDWIGSHVFARVSPRQKLDLVTVLQEKHFVVGMTGDGVNDAPALRKADIGIAMGERGTQVAQEASDMILKDDSFSSIVIAIREGRAIFDNIRKFVIYLLSCNLSELLIISIAAILNFHFQLFPLQILFINLITDVLPALALGVTNASPGIMNRSPRPFDEPIIDVRRWKTIIVYSLLISATCLSSVFISHYTVHKTEHWNPELCNNILFFTLIFSQLLHAFNMGSSDSTIRKSEILRNGYLWVSIISCIGLIFILISVPIFRQALKIYRMSFEDWAISIVCSILAFVIIQALKKVKFITQ